MLRFLRENTAILIILFFGLITRILLSHTLTYSQDLYTFQLWSLNLVQHGFRNFYSSAISNYQPGYLYVLMFLGKVFYWFLNHGVLIDIELFYKSPSILSDLGNALLIFLIAKKIVSKKLALATSLIAVFNPALIVNSTLWGQIDSFTSFFLLLSLYLLLTKKYLFSAFALGLAQVFKPVAILLVPIYLLWLHRQHLKLSSQIAPALIFVSTIILAFVPFYSSGNFFLFLLDRYKQVWFFTYISLNAFNFWGFLTALHSVMWIGISDQIIFAGLSYQNWGYLLFLTSYLYLLWNFGKKLTKIIDPKRQIFLLVLTISLSCFLFFMFLTRTSERHLYYALIFLSIIVLGFKNWRQKIIVSTAFIIYLLNLYFAYFQAGHVFLPLPTFVYFLAPFLLLVIILYLLKYAHDY